MFTALVWVVIVVGAATMITVGVDGRNLFDRLVTGEYSVPGSQSDAANVILRENSSTGETITLAVQGVAPSGDEVSSIVAQAHERLVDISGIESILDPFDAVDGTATDIAALFSAQDGQGFLVVATLHSNLTEADSAIVSDAVVASFQQAGNELEALEPGAAAFVGSGDLILAEITDQVKADLITGELVALPLALVMMVLVFGGLMAASMPLAGAIASILTGLGAMFALTFVMDIDASIINVATVLGLGLSIDYGLLVVSRFREELARFVRSQFPHLPTVRPRDLVDELTPAQRRQAVTHATVTTLSTAGRTVAFSAVTIALSIAGLIIFTPPVLRAIGAVGLIIVLLSVTTAMTLVPAVLRLAGMKTIGRSPVEKLPGVDRVMRYTADVEATEGVFSRLAGWVQRRAPFVVIGCVALLVFLASPVLDLQMRNSGIELLPTTATQRQFTDTLAQDFPQTRSADIQVVVDGSDIDAADLGQRIDTLSGVRSVVPPSPLGDYFVVGVLIDGDDPGSPQAAEVVREIRELESPANVLVTGQAASQVDFQGALGERLWLVVSVVVLSTMVLLFFMTGSLVIPIKALFTNVVSLGASLGILVWVFQDNHLSGILNFTSTGGIETFVVALVLAFGFGLAMDYEVFLLSRIKEFVDAGHDSEKAVRLGLQRSGRIITSAAGIIIIVFAGFVAGDLLVIKQVGFALAVAVFIDATIVRMLLVPATMTLLGRWNWWAPAPLAKLYNRFAIIH